MTMRTIVKTVAFLHPFRLSGVDEEQPAGNYEVETDEELIEDMSFLGYRRIATLIHLPVLASRPGIRQTLTIDPAELATVMEADRIKGEDGEPTGPIRLLS
jgi:hypothetical protein